MMRPTANGYSPTIPVAIQRLPTLDDGPYRTISAGNGAETVVPVLDCQERRPRHLRQSNASRMLAGMKRLTAP